VAWNQPGCEDTARDGRCRGHNLAASSRKENREEFAREEHSSENHNSQLRASPRRNLQRQQKIRRIKE